MSGATVVGQVAGQVVRLQVRGIGLVGPGLTDWAQARAVLRGEQPAVTAPTVLSAPMRLPPAERRRAGVTIKAALAVAEAACADAALDPAALATVFTSSSGDGANCHALCEALAGADRLISPTRFTNSVHNAAAGYWHIAVGSRAPSTSLCAYDGSWGAGLIEAAMKVGARGQPVLLVASDAPYPQPLHTTRPLADAMGVALVLAPATQAACAGHATLALSLESTTVPSPAGVALPEALQALGRTIPAAQALPLLAAIARGLPAELGVDARAGVRLRVQVLPS